jgi:hypothetical protein
MQNKPNFPKSQMNINPYNTTNYENIANWTIGQNKPNQTQFPKSQNELKIACQKIWPHPDRAMLTFSVVFSYPNVYA